MFCFQCITLLEELNFRCKEEYGMKREKLITGIIISCFFGGLVGGPVASLIDYYGPPEERFRLFIIPEFIGFVSIGFLVYYGRSKKVENR